MTTLTLIVTGLCLYAEPQSTMCTVSKHLIMHTRGLDRCLSAFLKDHQTFRPVFRDTFAPARALANFSICCAMESSMNPQLTQADTIVLKNLFQDINGPRTSSDPSDLDDKSSIDLLTALSDETSDKFQPTIFTGWDGKDLLGIPDALHKNLLQPYVKWAQQVVRRPTDVVFLTHILLYLSTSVPSAIYLFYTFTWAHGICHWLMQAWYAGAFTLLLHNHIHNNGVLSRDYAWFDRFFPYVLEPLMGHTWDSYFHHHVKHHHTESNGPDDLSSTIRYQRDELKDLLQYIGRFLILVWLDLPLYFLHKGKRALAVKTFVSEISSYAFIYLLAKYNFRASLFVLLLPLLQMRIAMMVGNWGQHAFVDETEPTSDLRSSITLIDVPVSFVPPNPLVAHHHHN